MSVMSVNLKMISFGIAMLAMTGCSPVMAARQPGDKDLTVLREGTPRHVLIGEFGAPASSEVKDGIRTDIFAFRQGYSTGARVGRTVLHAVFDVFTLGLWEVVGTPVEAGFSGSDMSVQVTYDPDDKVKTVSVGKQ